MGKFFVKEVCCVPGERHGNKATRDNPNPRGGRSMQEHSFTMMI